MMGEAVIRPPPGRRKTIGLRMRVAKSLISIPFCFKPSKKTAMRCSPLEEICRLKL